MAGVSGWLWMGEGTVSAACGSGPEVGGRSRRSECRDCDTMGPRRSRSSAMFRSGAGFWDGCSRGRCLCLPPRESSPAARVGPDSPLRCGGLSATSGRKVAFSELRGDDPKMRPGIAGREGSLGRGEAESAGRISTAGGRAGGDAGSVGWRCSARSRHAAESGADGPGRFSFDGARWASGRAVGRSAITGIRGRSARSGRGPPCGCEIGL